MIDLSCHGLAHLGLPREIEIDGRTSTVRRLLVHVDYFRFDDSAGLSVEKQLRWYRRVIAS